MVKTDVEKEQDNINELHETIINALKTIEDPEIGIDIYTLGLIYEVKIDDKIINIKMTLTSPSCPFGPYLIDNVKKTTEKIAEGKTVNVDLVFTPPWEPSEELRTMLGV